MRPSADSTPLPAVTAPSMPLSPRARLADRVLVLTAYVLLGVTTGVVVIGAYLLTMTLFGGAP